MAEKYYSWSGYNYVMGNPVRLVDPDGRNVQGDYYDRQGNYLGNDGIDDGKIYLVEDGVSAEDLGLDADPLTGMLFSDVRAASTTEVGGLMILERTEEGEDYTQGELTMIGSDGSQIYLFTLEPAGPETTTPNQDRRIPDGVYDVDAYSSVKHPDTFILSNDSVGKERRILIHSGNTGRHTEGCVLPGCTNGTGWVGHSGQAMDYIRDFFRQNNVSTIDTSDDIKMIIRTNINAN